MAMTPLYKIHGYVDSRVPRGQITLEIHEGRTRWSYDLTLTEAQELHAALGAQIAAVNNHVPAEG